MKNFVIHLQTLSLIFTGLALLLLLGAEPGTTEQSMYEYEHFLDAGNGGWYILWFGGISFSIFILSTIIRIAKK